MKNQQPLIDQDFKEFLDAMKELLIKDSFLRGDQKFKQALIDLTASKDATNMSDNEYLGKILSIAQLNSFEMAVNFSLELLSHYHNWLINNHQNALGNVHQD